MPITLTPKAIAALKPGAKPHDVWDAHTTGLGIRTFPSGRQSWSIRYRHGRLQRRLTLGSFPAVSLAKARERGRAAILQVSGGVDPAAEKVERREADTVAEFINTFIEKYSKPKKKSWRHDRARFNNEILPRWGNRLVRDITKRDVRELLDEIAARPAPIMANRVRALLRTFFGFALTIDVVTVNPVLGTVKPGQERQRDRVLTAEEIRTFWAACDTIRDEMATAFKFMLATAQRKGEVFGARWSDIDLETGWWTIPATQAKNKLSHRVPLSPLAIEILAERQRQIDAHLAQHPYAKKQPLIFAKVRCKRQQRYAFSAFAAIPNFRGHDLRRTAASFMTGSGISRLVVAKILNHVETSVTAVYDRHSYDPEKKIALDQWARQLNGILHEEQPANVLPFAGARA
jgi:integrase